MRIDKFSRSKTSSCWLLVWDWPVDRRGRALVSSWLIGSLLCLSTGCTPRAAAPDQDKLVQDVTVLEVGPLKVVAKQCQPHSSIGVVSTDGIAIVANENSQIGSISGTVFYDHDRNGEFNLPKDGLILKVDKSIETLSSEAVFSPGVFHSGPGIGPLRINCVVETVASGGEKVAVNIKADLSPIFDTEHQ